MSDRLDAAADSCAPDIDDWRRLIKKSGRDVAKLRSRSRDGIPIDPLYAARTDVQSLAGRASKRWGIVQIIDHADPDAANEQAILDVEGGATGLSMRFAGGPSSAGAGLPLTREALGIALNGIDLAGVEVRLEPHAAAPQLARHLAEWIARSGVAPELAAISPGLDPVAVQAFRGRDSSVGFSDYVECFGELKRAGLRGPLATLDTRIYHEAGATEAQELAALLATAAWWLRALDEAGSPPAESMPFFGAGLAVDHDQFLSIAKLRAAQLMWTRLQELCAISPSRLSLHAETSRRMMTRAEPMTNLLRTTVAAFAASVGGADSIAVLPHDIALGAASAGARALARSMQHLLMEESHLHVVSDPAAGSGAVEALTEELAKRGWDEFRTIEREGGIVESLRSDAFQIRIAQARDALSANVASGTVPLVGVTMHRHADEETVSQTASFRTTAGLTPITLEELARAAA